MINSDRQTLRFIQRTAVYLHAVLRLTVTSRGADVVQQIHDEVQVHPLIIEAVVVQFEQLLLLSAHLCTATRHQTGLAPAALLSQRTAEHISLNLLTLHFNSDKPLLYV